MARTDKSRKVERAENRIALTLDIDDSLTHIAERTTNQEIIKEVNSGRSFVRRLFDSLVQERKELQQGNADD